MLNEQTPKTSKPGYYIYRPTMSEVYANKQFRFKRCVCLRRSNWKMHWICCESGGENVRDICVVPRGDRSAANVSLLYSASLRFLLLSWWVYRLKFHRDIDFKSAIICGKCERKLAAMNTPLEFQLSDVFQMYNGNKMFQSSHLNNHFLCSSLCQELATYKDFCIFIYIYSLFENPLESTYTIESVLFMLNLGVTINCNTENIWSRKWVLLQSHFWIE